MVLDTDRGYAAASVCRSVQRWAVKMEAFLTRTDAVNYLKKKGYDAFKRDWVMGKTVGVGTGRTEHPNGITSYKRMAFIAPQNDKWLVTEFDNHTTENEQVYSTLKEACDGVEKLFKYPKLKAYNAS